MTIPPWIVRLAQEIKPMLMWRAVYTLPPVWAWIGLIVSVAIVVLTGG